MSIRAVGHLIIAAFVACGVAVASERRAPSIQQVLDAYSHGSTSATEIAFSNEGEFLRFRAALEQEGVEWISAAGPDRVLRRRHVLCAFVLEWLFANSEYWTDVSQGRSTAFWTPGRYQFDWQAISSGILADVPAVVEWAWQTLQTEPASDFTHAWSFAAVTFLWDVTHYDFYVFDAPEQPTNLRGAWESRYGVPLQFLKRVRARFPDDARLGLRAAIGSSTAIHQELATRISQRRETPYAEAIETIRRGAALRQAERVDSKDVEIGLADTHLLKEADGLSILDRVCKALVPFRQIPDVRADADLELGMIAMSFAQHDEARGLFDELLQSQPTPCQAYHAHFLRGRVDEEDNRIADAANDYRHALRLMPSAQSAVSSLAALLWLQDRPAEATTRVGRELAEPRGPDPWGWVLSAPCSHWPEAIGAVRATLK